MDKKANIRYTVILAYGTILSVKKLTGLWNWNEILRIFYKKYDYLYSQLPLRRNTLGTSSDCPPASTLEEKKQQRSHAVETGTRHLLTHCSQAHYVANTEN